MKRNNYINIFLTLCLVAGLSATVIAADSLDFSIEIDATAATTLSGYSAWEPDCVGVTHDGTILYTFDSHYENDSLIRKNLTSGTLTTIATEAEIMTAAGIAGSASVSGGDLVVDSSGAVYLLFYCSTDGHSHIIKFTGDNFATAVRMNAVGEADDVLAIALDETNSRLVFYVNGVFNASATEDIRYFALTDTDATATVLAAEADLLAALPSGDELDMNDLTVQSDGTIIVSNGFYPNGSDDGTLLRVTTAGAVSTFLSATDLVAAGGGASGSDFYGNVHLQAMSTDQILIVPDRVSSGFETSLLMAEYDGSLLRLVATETDVETDADMTGYTPINLQGHGLEALPDDTIYWASQEYSSVSGDAIIKLTGLDTESLGVENWDIFE
jgi:hypothetical protein